MNTNGRNDGAEENLRADVEETNESSVQRALPSQPRRGEAVVQNLLGEGHFYQGKECSSDTYMVIHSRFMYFTISQPNVSLEKGFHIKMETCEPGRRHPNVFVQTALDEDLCSRLAVKAKMTLTDGRIHEQWLRESHYGRLKAPMVYNAVCDWLLGNSWAKIARDNQPRRFVKVYSNEFGLEKFSGAGNYPDGSVSVSEQNKWDSDKRKRQRK